MDSVLGCFGFLLVFAGIAAVVRWATGLDTAYAFGIGALILWAIVAAFGLWAER